MRHIFLRSFKWRSLELCESLLQLLCRVWILIWRFLCDNKLHDNQGQSLGLSWSQQLQINDFPYLSTLILCECKLFYLLRNVKAQLNNTGVLHGTYSIYDTFHLDGILKLDNSQSNSVLSCTFLWLFRIVQGSWFPHRPDLSNDRT